MNKTVCFVLTYIRLFQSVWRILWILLLSDTFLFLPDGVLVVTANEHAKFDTYHRLGIFQYKHLANWTCDEFLIRHSTYEFEDNSVSNIPHFHQHQHHVHNEEQLRNDSFITPACKVCNEVQDGDVIWCNIASVKQFITSTAPNLHAHFVLVSGDSDKSIPASVGGHDIAIPFLQNANLLHWYTTNCDSNPLPAKFTCLPLGLSANDNGLWHWKLYLQQAYLHGWGLIQGLTQDPTDFRNSSDHVLLVAFSVRANPAERTPPYMLSCSSTGRLSHISHCFTDDVIDHVSNYTAYYQALSRARFAYSPHGMGLDCHRTWEALYMGAYPIVKTSSLDQLYRDLPVLIVQDWEDITEDLLEQIFQIFHAKAFNFEQLYIDYWDKKFRSHFTANK